MYSRSELRHVCYRAKNNALSDQQKPVAEMIQSLLQVGQTFNNFTTQWDLLVTKVGIIKIISPETDYDFIHSTLIEASLFVKRNISFDSFDDRQANIISQVETLMLDNIMTWENYNQVWGVDLDPTLKTLKTKLYNVDPKQKQVTDQMIEDSKKDADGSALSTPPEPNVLEVKPMDDQQVKEFEAFLAKKYPQKG